MIVVAGAGLVYFIAVFAAGFVLGTVRVMLLVPVLGERGAELLEMPFMLAVVCVSAYLLARKQRARLGGRGLLGAGFVALGLLVAAELGLVLTLRGLTFAEYVASRDPISGSAYLFSLGVFALAPWAAAGYLAARERRS